ncbi:helix-turn-helix transcriptional regulator [uncultured Pseudoteredinibacter sp.]|uniref:helix-turn-helix domain-containing protein n=1 Tax=uncultured Pseudoteredinibacter sp. TaxID=1641701 RepID=UPI0026297D14|nr:helix-turn-helix transcriptional regulator [uncultured Pseudoteredinibacter sp.]
MSVLQISKPQASLQLGKVVAKIYSFIHILDQQSFRAECINHIQKELSISGLHWFTSFGEGSGLNSREGEISSPITFMDSSLEQAQSSYLNYCEKSNCRHAIYIDVNKESSDVDDSLCPLEILGPQLVQAHRLQLLYAALRYCRSLDFDFCLFDFVDKVRGSSDNLCSETSYKEGFSYGENAILFGGELLGYRYLEILQIPEIFNSLSNKEKKITFFVAKAKTNKEIALALECSEKTIENQLTTIYRKLSIRSRAMLIHNLKSYK